jgi:hypothetical protein
MKRAVIIAGMLITTLAAFGQTVGVDSYIGDMREALINTGRITAEPCHHVDIEIDGGWGYAKVPDGVDQRGHYTYTMLKN